MSADCIFCKIAAGEIPSDFVYQDDEIVAFRDINPLAPTHVLIVPKRHIPAVSDTTEADSPLLARMLLVANQIARDAGIAATGYRLVINSGVEGGQVVGHLHLHLLGGQKLNDVLG
jgi:histidine triad (HIT) family protein